MFVVGTSKSHRQQIQRHHCGSGCPTKKKHHNPFASTAGTPAEEEVFDGEDNPQQKAQAPHHHVGDPQEVVLAPCHHDGIGASEWVSHALHGAGGDEKTSGGWPTPPGKVVIIQLRSKRTP